METSCKNLVKENNDWKADSNSGGQQMHCCGAVDKGDATMEEDRQNENEPLLITEMPDSIVLSIFSYLPFSSIGNVAQVCQRWWQICTDELLWREVFLRHYKLPLDTKLSVKAKSWRSEFKRVYYHTPCLLSEERKEHRDEVLHISFSNDGTMFATCSKDGFFKVWECGQPCRLLFEKDMMSSFSWKFTQFSQFNETDTCLLVSGVYFGCLSTSGEIAVFNLQDGFNMQCRVTNKPYDVFGTWYDNDHLLSGTLLWTGDFNSVSAVWLSKASQEVESEMESVSMVLYRFQNRNSSSIRLLHIAEIERDDEDISELERIEMDHSPLSLEQGEITQAYSSQALQTIDAASANRDGASAGMRADVAVGEDEAFSGCETSLLDKLLKKSIAENEFDLENEDDTDIEEDTRGGDDDSGMAGGGLGRKGNDDNSSNSSHITDHHSHDGGMSMTSHGLVDTARGCDCENECQDQEEEFGEGGSGGKSITGDSMVKSVGVNVNFISFGEPPHPHTTTSVNNCFNSDMKQSAEGYAAGHVWTDSLPSGHSSQYNESQNLKDLMVEKYDSIALEWSVRNACDSSSSSSSSCCSSNSSSEEGGGGGESINCNNSGSNSSRGLSGGFVTCGVNNNSMETTCQQSCDCDDDDSLMEDDECVSHPQCMTEPASLSPLPTTVSGGTLFSLQGSDDDNVCTEGGRVVKREENVSPFQGRASIEDNLLLKTQMSDCVKGSRAGISPSNDTYTDQATTRGSFHHTPLSHNKNDTSDACASDNSCDTDYTSKRRSLPDSNSSRATVADNELSSFHNDSAVKNDLTTVTGPRGTEGVEEEGLLLGKGSFSHCGNSNNNNSKTMDNAATQTEESSGASLSSSLHSSMAHMSHSSSLSRDAVPKRVTDKFLIYTWGSETYIPHKIGIKRIKRSDFCKGEVKARQSSMLLPDVMENLHNTSGEARRDKPDVSIDMHGHIVGLSLSPDDRYLYVNCRAWPKNYIISDPQQSPPLAQEVEISAIDLKTFQFVGPVLRSHKAYTHSDECFFLNLDVSNDYVVSGAEDRKGYIWDRHYGMCLGQFEHRNVVNCMAACPSDPEIAISVSDDHTFKVWMSRAKLKEVEDKMGNPSTSSTTSPSSSGQLTHRNSLVQEEEDSH